MSCEAEERLTSAIDTTCAAVYLVAALLLSTYFLNDWPAHMLSKHKVLSSYIWRPAQRPAPFVVRQVRYLGGKIFITLRNLKEVVHREELSLLSATTLHYKAKQACLAGLNMSDRYVRLLAQ